MKPDEVIYNKDQNVVVAVSVGKEDRTASLMIRDGKP